MDLADLRFFDAVAREGGINRAALTLNTVQSNVTARIAALETKLGVRLFERGARGVSLTAAGKRLLPYAQKMFALAQEASQAARDDGAPSGPLTIGALETTAALRLPPLLGPFVAGHPDVDLTIRSGITVELVPMVMDDRLDGALVAGPVRHTGLVEQPIFREELALLAPPGIETIEMLLELSDRIRLLVLRSGCSYRQRLEAVFARRGLVGLKTLEFGTLEAIVGCIGAGLGVTLLPRAMVGTVWPENRVSILTLPREEAEVQTVFIRRRERAVSSALRAFISHIGGDATDI